MAIDTIKSTAVLDGAIATADIADNAVTTAKVADDAVTTAKVADDAVTSAKLDTNIAVAGNLAVDTDTLFVDASADKVGINQASPTYQLSVLGATQSTVEIESASTTGESRLYMTDPDAAGVGEIGYYHNGDTMRFNTAGTERFRVSASGIHIGGTGAANALDDYEEGEFSFTLTDNHGGSDTTNKMRYVKVGAMVFVEGPNRGSAGSNVQQYALLSGTANSDITLTATLPFVPIETGMAISGIHRNLEKRDGSNENASSGNWLPMIGWIAGSATLTLTDTQSEKSYSAAAGGMTLRKADNRTNIVMGFNFVYRTAS